MRFYPYYKGFCLLCIAVSSFAFTEEPTPVEQAKEEVAVFLTRSDNIPERGHTPTDTYFEGYIQALVDMHYHEFSVVVFVKENEVWLSNLPHNDLLSRSIITFVRDVPGVEDVHILDGVPEAEEEIRDKYVERPHLKGEWFPQLTVLYQPMMANPREIDYSLGWRQGDRVIGHKCVQVSMGDELGLYRWLDVWNYGDIQVSISACIWSVFNMDPHPNIVGGSARLVNTDFFVGVPFSYAVNKWSFRLMGYHISSHLGDEFMVDIPKVRRINPSFEVVEGMASFQALNCLRLYGGMGVIVHWDETFPMKPIYFQYGLEFRFIGTKFHCQRLYGTLFLAAHFRSVQFLHWGFDGTFVGGYEFSKLQGIGRKMRFFVEYHNGFSLEGQFMKRHTQYISYLFSYGF
ncbi:MAG TPA: DUF1207 domain-containing protein [Chlamydiales bacterium]|nr:DUF1207 domain-containing protein [Chlamydiales bacterium]